MVRKFSIIPEESDLSLDEEERDREADPLHTSHPSWSSRFKCFEAYICIILGLTPAVQYCKTIATYGSFVFFAYILIALTVGVPIVYVEILIGRYVTGSVTKAWSMCPLSKGVLICLLGTTAFNIVVNNIYTAYIFKYLFSFYRGYIPWEICREPWARDNCFVTKDNETTMMKCLTEHVRSYCLKVDWESSGTQYWKYVAGNTTDYREMCLMAFYLSISTGVVTLINLKGHRSCEKAFKVLIYAPIIISFVITFVSYASIGALTGVLLFFDLDWNKLFRWKMWLNVFEDTVSSLRLATLGLTCVSSHGKFSDNIFVDVLVVIFAFIFLPPFVVIPILSLIGSVSELYNAAPVSPGIILERDDRKVNVFIWISEIVLQFPYPGVFWAFVIYLEMLLMCLGTQCVMALAFTEALEGLFLTSSKFLCNAITAIMSLLLSTPYIFITFNFEFPIETTVITIMLLYAIIWQILYGFRKFNDDCHFMMGYTPPLFLLKISWISLIPILVLILGLKMYHRIPNTPVSYVVFIYIGLPIVVYLIVATVQISIALKRKENVGALFTADPDWGPENRILKMSRVILDTRTVNKEFLYRQELFRKPMMKPPDFSQQNVVQLL